METGAKMNDDIRQCVARELYWRRGMANMSKRDISDDGGPTVLIQSRIEQARIDITLEQLFHWCDAVGCTADEVVRSIDEERGRDGE